MPVYPLFGYTVTDLIQQLQAKIAALETELKSSETARVETVARLEARIAWLEHRLFGGAKSEKLDRNQMLLELEQLQALVETEKRVQNVSYERTVPSAKQTPRALEDAFAKLPVDEVKVIEPKEVLAEPGAFEQISEERTFEVDVTPPRMFKRDGAKRRRACRRHDPKASAEGRRSRKSSARSTAARTTPRSRPWWRPLLSVRCRATPRPGCLLGSWSASSVTIYLFIAKRRCSPVGAPASADSP
jgi:hypothetical protein